MPLGAARMNWALLAVGLLGGLALSVVILLGLVVMVRRRERSGRPVGTRGLTVRVDEGKAQGAGRLIAVGLVLFAVLVTTGSPSPHRGRFFFGFLAAEGLLMAVFGWFLASNRSLPDISAEEFARMSFLERHAALQTYGAGRSATALQVATRLVVPLAVCGFIVALVLNW